MKRVALSPLREEATEGASREGMRIEAAINPEVPIEEAISILTEADTMREGIRRGSTTSLSMRAAGIRSKRNHLRTWLLMALKSSRADRRRGSRLLILPREDQDLLREVREGTTEEVTEEATEGATTSSRNE